MNEIATLRAEALLAGDDAQVRMCDRAIAGDETARAACLRVIEYAAAEAAIEYADRH